MKRYGSFRIKNSEEIKKREEEFLEYLKSVAIEIDGCYFLPNVVTIDIHQNSPSSEILMSLKKEGRIVSLGRRSKLDLNLIRKIEEKLNKEPEKKAMWFWRKFFMNPLRFNKGKGPRCFTNTSWLYEIR